MGKEDEKTINPIGSGNPDISLVDATIVQLIQDLREIKKEVETQRSESKNIIIGAVFALILIVGAVAVEVILSNRVEKQFYSGLDKDIYEQNLKVQDLNNKIDILKIRNYLK